MFFTDIYTIQVNSGHNDQRARKRDPIHRNKLLNILELLWDLI